MCKRVANSQSRMHGLSVELRGTLVASCMVSVFSVCRSTGTIACVPKPLTTRSMQLQSWKFRTCAIRLLFLFYLFQGTDTALEWERNRKKAVLEYLPKLVLVGLIWVVTILIYM